MKLKFLKYYVLTPRSSCLLGVTDKAKGLWAKNKYYIIIGLIGVAIIFIICCCCICRKKMKKKKKKDQEKVKLKGAKPGKKLQRIQPGKIEKKAMVFSCI